MTREKSLEIADINTKIAIAVGLFLIVFLLMYIAFWR